MRWFTDLKTRLRSAWRYLFWEPTHIHLKTCGGYRVLRKARLEKTLEVMIVYESRSGMVWIRPENEFFDGRFQKIGHFRLENPGAVIK